MPDTLIRAACIASLLAAPALPARAEMGSCLPDDNEGLICGSGDGSARVIDNTLSPSKKFGFAWRTPNTPPTTEPDEDKIELVLLRIRDGTILMTGKTVYWDTGERHVNRLQEQASWSPNSRLVLRAFQERFQTTHLDAYAIDKHGKLAGSIDLIKIMNHAVRNRLRPKAKDADDFDFSLAGGKEMKVSDGGLVRAHVMLWMPKFGPEHHYAVTLQVMHKSGGELTAKVVSVAPARER